MANISVKKLRKLVNSVYNSETNKKIRKDMDRYLKYFTGQYWKDEELKDKTQSGVTANFVFSTIMTIAPMLTDNKPKWTIRARKPHMQRVADVYKNTGDCLWNILEMDSKLFDLVLDALTMKTGIIKIFFDPEADEFGEIAVDIIDPREFVIAPGYTDPWNAPWCGIITRKPLDWIRKTFPKNGRDVQPDEIDPEINYEEAEDYELCDQFATIYEIWFQDSSVEEYIEESLNEKTNEIEKKKKERPKYKNGSRIITFAKNLEEPLEDKEYPYNHKKAPYVPLYDYKIPHSFWGMGEVDQIETLTLEFNLLLKKISKYVRLWSDPNFISESSNGIDPEKWKEEAPGGGNLFLIEPGTAPPSAVVMPQINPTCTDFAGGIPKLMEEVNGVTDTTKGIAAKKQRQSAHEISALLETSYTRTRQRVRNLEAAIKRIFILMIELMQQYYTENRTYGRKTDTGNEWFDVSNTKNFALEATRPRIPEGETPEPEDELAMQDYESLLAELTDEESVYIPFDISIETNSTLPLDKQSLANLFLQLANVQLGPNSVIDTRSLLEVLQIPNVDGIMARIEAMQQKAMQQQQPMPQTDMEGVM